MSATLGLSCPDGGSFYICDKGVTRFIGCCTIDPCANGTGVCPKEHLKTSSFSSDAYMNIPAQSCDAPTKNNTWYTCSAKPPFMGCCVNNPCRPEGCAQADLLPAKLSDTAADAQVFLNVARGTESSGGGLPIGATVGIAVGGAVLFGVIAAFIAYRCGWFARRRREEKKSKSSGDEATKLYDATSDGGMGGLAALHSGAYSARDWPDHERLRSEHGSPSPRFPSPGHSPGFSPYSPADLYNNNNKHYSDGPAEHHGFADRKTMSPISSGSPFLDHSNRTSLGPDRASSQTYGRYSAVSNNSYEPPYHRSPGHSRNPSDQTNHNQYPAALGISPAQGAFRPYDDPPHVAMELEASQPQPAAQPISELSSEMPGQHYR